MKKKSQKAHERKEIKEEDKIIKIAKKMKRNDKVMLKGKKRNATTQR